MIQAMFNSLNNNESDVSCVAIFFAYMNFKFYAKSLFNDCTKVVYKFANLHMYSFGMKSLFFG